ncbi:hypothetical protein ACHWQZ_G010408 [Mnemiopsis leidyi]
MPTFSKFITSQRGAQQILDSDGYIYSRKKSGDTALTSTWRCAKYNPPTKCKCHIYLALADNSLTLGTQPHNHSADGSVPARQEVLLSLKRKAADQPLSATQNLISETLADTAAEVNQTLPNLESLARVVQRSRASSSGSAQHAKATTSEDFILPSKYSDWIADGTFYVAPKIFPQSYTIHSVVDAKCLPLI